MYSGQAFTNVASQARPAARAAGNAAPPSAGLGRGRSCLAPGLATPPAAHPGAAVFPPGFLLVQGETSALAASWDPFRDDETGVVSYSYQAGPSIPAASCAPRPYERAGHARSGR